MGTRGAYGFKINNQYKLSYNHYDSYPQGLGAEITSTITLAIKEFGLDVIKERVKNITLVNGSDAPDLEIQKRYERFSDEIQGRVSAWYMQLNKVTSKENLFLLASGEIAHMIDCRSFVYDSLFCEWAYIINLDTNMLEVYSGFQKKPQPGNPFGEKPNDDGYYPVALLCVFPLNNIPKNWVKGPKLKDE